MFIEAPDDIRLPETKKQKPTRRVLVIGKYRILSIVRKKLGGHKISRNFHLLELIEINQQERDKVQPTARTRTPHTAHAHAHAVVGIL